MVTLGVAAYVFLLLGRDESEQRDAGGRVIFTSSRPQSPGADSDGAGGIFSLASRRRALANNFSDWWKKSFEDLMTWDKNPWQRERHQFGSHYQRLLESDDPDDQAELAEIRKKAEELFQRLLERYPELAVEYRDIPPEKNGFLKWLEFQKRRNALSSDGRGQMGLPDFLIYPKGPWDSATARAWLMANASLMDEVRAIGLLPDCSAAGVPVEDLSSNDSQLIMGAVDALLMEARVAAEDGRVEAAMEAVAAARGLGNHLGDIETPTMVSHVMEWYIETGVQGEVLRNIFPALPEGQRDAAAWRGITSFGVLSPQDSVEFLRGEMNVGLRNYILPMVVNSNDPYSPPDPADLIDTYANSMLTGIGRLNGDSPADWIGAGNAFPENPDFSHLSYESEELLDDVFSGTSNLTGGFRRVAATTALQDAAFDIMRGEPVPNDPLHGQPYLWNPETRELSVPATPEYSEYFLKPIFVPKS